MDTYIFVDGNNKYTFKFHRIEKDLFITMNCCYGNGFHGCERKLSQFVEEYKDSNSYISKSAYSYCLKLIKNLAFL